LVDFDGAKSLAEYETMGEASLNVENPIYSKLFSATDALKLWKLKLTN